MVKSLRVYRSEVRTEQATRTRARIIEGARRRFLEAGYAGTSIASIAKAARVAPETIYDVFGTKRRLLEAVVDDSIAGALDEPANFLDRDWVAELRSLPDVRDRIDGFARHTAETVARMAPIHAVIRAAAAADTTLADLPTHTHEMRFNTQRRILEALAQPGQLRPDAAETFSAIASPELHHVLRVIRGWSQEGYADWLRRTAAAVLLASYS